MVDPRATPMAIVAAFGNQFVGRDGCGAMQFGSHIYLNGGTGSLVTNPTEFSLYRFKDHFPAVTPTAWP